MLPIIFCINMAEQSTSEDLHDAPRRLPRNKKTNFSLEETHTITERVISEMELLRGRHNNSVTTQMKNNM